MKKYINKPFFEFDNLHVGVELKKIKLKKILFINDLLLI